MAEIRLIQDKCLNCSAPLVVDRFGAKCEYCGSRFTMYITVKGGQVSFEKVTSSLPPTARSNIYRSFL